MWLPEETVLAVRGGYPPAAVALGSLVGDRDVVLVRPRSARELDDRVRQHVDRVTTHEPGPVGWERMLWSAPLSSVIVVDARASWSLGSRVLQELWMAEVPLIVLLARDACLPDRVDDDAQVLRVEVGGTSETTLVRLPRSRWDDNPSPRVQLRLASAAGRRVAAPVVLDPRVDRPHHFRSDAGRAPRLLRPTDGPGATARLRAGVVDGATSDDPVEVARVAIRASAWGLPVLLADGPWREHVGPGLLAAIDGVATIDLTDAFARERCSVRVRRAAVREHGGLAAAPVSVLVATKRPDLVDHAASQIERQTVRPLEVVIGAHGEDVAREVERAGIVVRLADRGIATSVVTASADVAFGDLLNRMTAAASGVVISKMDDDDWYGPDHVQQLVDALRWSGARMVGRAGEFIYLSSLGVTVRRQATGSERWSTLISGATLTLRRDDLIEVGGWAGTNRAVDRRLVDAVVRSGEFPYRTDGFGFVVNRHGRGQTWTVGAEYFLRRTFGQWRGKALEEAMARGD